MAAELRVDARRLWLGPGRTIENGAVVISGEEVIFAGAAARAPEVAEVRRVPFLAPGIVDHHVHVGLTDPRAILAGGVTLVRDLAWPLAEIRPLATRSREAGFDGPRIEFCGPMLTAPGGYPTDRRWAPPGTGLEVATPRAARAAVGRLLDAGAIAIKVALNRDAGPTLADPVLAAICDSTHDRGHRVVAHVEGEGQVEAAVGAGIDDLAHTPWTAPIDDSLMTELARRCRIISTLDMHLVAGDGTSFETGLANLRRFHARGGRILYGTDLGNGSIPPGLHAGEVAHLVTAGLSPDELLTAMTPGRLTVGMRADLTGLHSDPAAGPDAFAKVILVVRSGRVRRDDSTAA